MTEKLKQKAKKWVKENTHTEPSAIFGEITVYPSAEKGYIAGATEATKELQEELDYAKSNCLFSDCDRVVRLKSQITELEAQIEKMKCCENCIHHSFWGDELKCNLMSYDDGFKCLKDKSKWELAE